MFIRNHKHVYIHAYSLTPFIHLFIYLFFHSFLCPLMFACILTYTHSHTHTHTHSHTLTYTLSHTHTYTHTHTLTLTHSHTHTNSHTHIHTLSHTHTNTLTHTYTLTHTHTYTYYVELFLRMSRRHKQVWGAEVCLHSFLTSASPSDNSFSGRKNPIYPLDMRLDAVEELKFHTLPRIEPWFLGHPTGNLVTILFQGRPNFFETEAHDWKHIKCVSQINWPCNCLQIVKIHENLNWLK
jgi:hypothetical protein